MAAGEGGLRFAMHRVDRRPWNAMNIDDVDEVDVM